jgi:hypothetical protein
MFGFFGKTGDDLLTCAQLSAEMARIKRVSAGRSKKHQQEAAKRIKELQAVYNSKCLTAPSPTPGPAPGPAPITCPALPTTAAPPGCYWESYLDANGCQMLRAVCPPPPAPPITYPPITYPPTTGVPGVPGGGFEPFDYGSAAPIYGGGAGSTGPISPPAGPSYSAGGFEAVDEYEDTMTGAGLVPMVGQVPVPTPGMGPFVEGGDELNQVLPALYNDDYGAMKVLRIVIAAGGGGGGEDSGGAMPGVGPVGPIVSEELDMFSSGMEGLSYIGLSRSLG